MEQIQMQESSHRRMSALVEYQLAYPDLTIREFFAMASEEEEEEVIDLSLEENAEEDV